MRFAALFVFVATLTLVGPQVSVSTANQEVSVAELRERCARSSIGKLILNCQENRTYWDQTSADALSVSEHLSHAGSLSAKNLATPTESTDLPLIRELPVCLTMTEFAERWSLEKELDCQDILDHPVSPAELCQEFMLSLKKSGHRLPLKKEATGRKIETCAQAAAKSEAP